MITPEEEAALQQGLTQDLPDQGIIVPSRERDAIWRLYTLIKLKLGALTTGEDGGVIGSHTHQMSEIVGLVIALQNLSNRITDTQTQLVDLSFIVNSHRLVVEAQGLMIEALQAALADLEPIIPPPLYNGLDQTQAGWSLDATQGKILRDMILGYFVTINKDQYGTHPAFTNQTDLNAYLLGGGAPADPQEPEFVTATIRLTLSQNTATVGENVTVALTYSVLFGDDIPVSGTPRRLWKKPKGAPENQWVQIGTPGQFDGVQNYSISESTDFKYTVEMQQTTPGYRESKVNTITFQAPPVYAYWGWKYESAPLTEEEILLSANKAAITSGADISADYRTNTSPMYLWMAEPASEPVKTKWYGSPTNQGSIGGSADLYGAPVVIGSMRFYQTQYRTQQTSTPLIYRK